MLEFLKTKVESLLHRGIFFYTLIFVGFILYRQRANRRPKIVAPSIGTFGFLELCLGSVQFILCARAMLEMGIQKYGQRSFKVPEFGKWRLIVSDPRLIEEIQRVPDHTMSFMESMKDTIAAEYTLGTSVANNPYYIGVIRSHLTRNTCALFSEVMDEIAMAIDEELPSTRSEWVALIGLETAIRLFSRATNRILVGPCICRNNDYIETVTHFTEDVMKAAHIINMFPSCMKKIVGLFLTSVPRSTRRAMQHLQGEIEYRLLQYREFQKHWPEKPNDFLSWLMDEAEGELLTLTALTQCILAVNFASVHTTAMTFTHALFHLSINPDLIQKLREEAEEIIVSDGWTPNGLSRLRKLDSFLKETQRFYGIGLCMCL